MSEEKKVNCLFMVMTDTGEQPDAEIHIAGFEREGGLAVSCHQQGGSRTLAQMAASVVGALCEDLKKTQGVMAVAAFLNILGMELAEKAGEEALQMATVMANPKTMANAIGKLMEDLDPDDIAKLFDGDEE